jgi:hypothetical protein
MRASFPGLLALLAVPASAQEWTHLKPELTSHAAGEANVTVLDDGSLRVEGGGDERLYRLVFPTEMEGVEALRIEVLPDPSLPSGGPGRAAGGNFVLSEAKLFSRVGRNRRALEWSGASASFSQIGWPVSAAIDGREDTGWAVAGNIGSPAEAVFNLAQPLGRGRRELELELTFNYGANHSIGRLRVSITNVNGARALQGQDFSKMQAAVDGAIDRGIGYLVDDQDLDGSWGGDQDYYRVGGTALNTYALVKSEVSARHQAVRRALAYIDANPPRKTYEAGCVLMLYAALDHGVYRDRARMVLEDLLDWQLGDWGYPGTHGDPTAGHADLSNTQYGALGYWAATKMGLEVPPPAWRRLAETVLRYQGSAGGFGYTPGAPPTGSMGAAGVTVLALCVDHLEGGLRRECEAGLAQGLEWLDQNFKPNGNPGAQTNWLLYFLYGIERVGAFSGRDSFNGMDWYEQGARFLLGAQLEKGQWSNPDRPQANTSFALLFLGRATASITGSEAGRTGKRTYGVDDPSADISLRAAGDTPLTVWISSFGDALLDGITFEGERELGPRVTRVEYLTEGGVVLADSRSGGALWSWRARAPAAGWTSPGTPLPKGWKTGRGAFGRVDSPQLAVGTAWEKPELWLVHDLELDLELLIEPRLEVSFSSVAPAKQRRVLGPLLKLYDEEAAFAGLLTAGSPAEQVSGGASGPACLKVAAVQRHEVAIPGWSFPIREKPGPGEYRYLRFRWRKAAGGRDSGGIMIQFAFDGSWNEAQRYHAGPNSVNFTPSLALTGTTPDGWQTVTRDLWADHGNGLLTGLALTPMDGEGYFDGLYLARRRSDLRGEEALRDLAPEWAADERGPAPAQEDALVLWVNGARVAALDRETAGFETWLAGDRLRAALRPGSNRLALRVRNNGLGRAVDLGLVDDRRLMDLAGRGDQSAKDERFPVQVKFPRPGRYRIWARVHVLDGVTREPVVFESPRLEVKIDEAFDQELLSYAQDAGQNLLLDGELTAGASSELGGWPAARAADGRYDLAWLCADGDLTPTLELKLRRPVRADTVLLSHTRVDRVDSARTNLPTRVALVFNGKGDPIVVQMDPSRQRKTIVKLAKPIKLRSIEVRVLDQSPGGDPLKNAVGFAEVELQLRGRGR